MRKTILNVLFILVVLLLGNSSLWAQKKSIDIKTSAICEMCQYAIEHELTYTKGVKSANLDLDTKKVTIEYNENKTSPEELRKVIALVGYHADNIKRDSTAYENLPNCCKDGAHGTKPHEN